TNTTWSPRVGFTYAMSPDSVIRFAYGRYTQPTGTYAEQVLTYEDGYQMATNVYNSSYYNNGFASVVHNNPIQFSNNWDASYEQHLKNTDWTFKLSPFYRYTSNQSVSVPLPGGLAGAFNSGTQKSEGVELAVQKGDVSKNGFSGELSYTYTYSVLKYALINGANIVTELLNSLKPLESLERVNGGSPCYYQGNPVANCNKSAVINGTRISPADFVINPYYNFTYTEASLASEFPATGFYPTYANNFPNGLQAGDASSIISPNVFSSFVSYKHNQLQVTLTGNLWEGTSYGSPGDVAGIDPRSCSFNQGQIGVVPGSRLADYQTCSSSIAIPNPATGQLATIGEFRNPWDLNLGAQLAYDVTPRIRVSALLANIGNWCFGGSAQEWTAAYPPTGSNICTYSYNTNYLGWSPGEAYNTAGAGYFYGNSPHSSVNGTTGYPKVFDQPYAPGSYQIPAPFQVFLTASIRL
ncbi:MAG: TonB-dependent receptor, partial [Candidatus Eremiobacteraeota bacterium]|nr:TonB-dependent receptor [Candidatus Eremiobacteraeota bacterium]